MNKTNRKGFTLAELLIVVAIIAVLVAIAIPVFTSQLHNAKASADMANLRAYYAELQTDFMTNGTIHKELQNVDNKPENPPAPGISEQVYKHLDGTLSTLNMGTYWLHAYEDGYQIAYTCGKFGCSKHSAIYSN